MGPKDLLFICLFLMASSDLYISFAQQREVGTCEAENQMQVFCFIGLWYGRINSLTGKMLDPYLCNHVIMAYMRIIDNGQNGWRLSYVENDPAEFAARMKHVEEEVQAGKKNTQFLISLGGYDDFHREKYTKIAQDKVARENFLLTVVKFLEENNLDGMDFFWNFIGRETWNFNSGLVMQDLEALSAIATQVCGHLRKQGYFCSITLRLAEGGEVMDEVKYQLVRNIVRYADIVHIWTADIFVPRLMPDDMLIPDNDVTNDPNYRHSINYITDFYTTALRNDPQLLRKLSMVIPLQWLTFAMKVEAPVYDSVIEQSYFEEAIKYQYPYFQICKRLKGQAGRNEFFNLTLLSNNKYPTAFSPNFRDSGSGLAVPFVDENYAKTKVEFARKQGFGAVSVFQIAADDVSGGCYQQSYPILTAINEAVDQCRFY